MQTLCIIAVKLKRVRGWDLRFLKLKYIYSPFTSEAFFFPLRRSCFIFYFMYKHTHIRYTRKNWEYIYMHYNYKKHMYGCIFLSRCVCIYISLCCSIGLVFWRQQIERQYYFITLWQRCKGAAESMQKVGGMVTSEQGWRSFLWASGKWEGISS